LHEYLSNQDGRARRDARLASPRGTLCSNATEFWTHESKIDVKRLAASVVIAAQHLELPNSDAASVAISVVREYRERIENYATMRTLDVWYDKIDLQRYEDRAGDPKVLAQIRKRVIERIEAEKAKSAPDHLFPKLASQNGPKPRIKDEPPADFSSDGRTGSRSQNGIRRSDCRVSRDLAGARQGAVRPVPLP
jgi:hypothetical protein